MASLSDTIDLIFKGTDDVSAVVGKVEGGLKQLKDAAGSVGDGIGNISAPFTALADTLLTTEAAALATGAALVGVAVNAADQFDVAFSEITTLIDQPIEGLQNFKAEILSYAATSTQSLDKVTQSVYAAISGGVAYTDSLGFIATAEKLAVAGKAELGDTVKGLISVLNAYGAGTAEAGRYSDIFFSAIKDGQTTLPELNASLSKVTSTAALGGVSFEVVAAAVATLTAAGAPTASAMTQLNAAISAIIKPTGEAADLAKSLGIEFDINALKSKGLGGVLADVAAKTGGAGDKMAVLFSSTEALSGANTLAVTSAGKFIEKLDNSTNSAGKTAAAFEKMKGATDTMAQAITVALVSFGTPLLESVGNTEEAIAKLAVGFIKASESGAFKGLQDLISGQLDSITQTIEAAAENLPAALEQVDWSGVLDSLEELGSTVSEVFGALFGDIDLTTVDGLASAIQTLMNSFESLTRIVSGIVGEFTPFAAAIGGTVRNFNELDDASKLEFGQTLGGMKAVTDAGVGLGLGLIAIGRAGLDMGDVLDVAFGGVKVVINSLQVAFDSVALGILQIGKSVLEGFLAINEAGAKLAFTDAAKKSNQAAIEGIKAQLAELTPVMDGVSANLKKNSGELDAGLAQMQKGFVGTSEEADKARQKLDASEAAIKAAAAAAKDGAEKVSDFGIELGKITVPKLQPLEVEVKNNLPQFTAAAAEASGQLTRTGEEANKMVPKLVTVRDANQNIVRTYTEMVPASSLAAGGFSIIGKSATESGKKVEEATKKSEDFLVKMESIASNERIKNIEATVSIKVAQLETDAERVKSVFESIDNTVTSTGELLGNLFGELTKASGWDKLTIRDQIDKENQRRQDVLDLQKKMAELEMERIQAQISALNRGDAILKIDGAGLKPELEAFMWKILSLIRVRANAEFSQYLLGVAT